MTRGIDPLEIIGMGSNQRAVCGKAGDKPRRIGLRKQAGGHGGIGQQAIREDHQLVLGPHQRGQVEETAQGLKRAPCPFHRLLHPQDLGIGAFAEAQDPLAPEAAQQIDLPRKHRSSGERQSGT